jgi:hypothetical protein
MVSAQCAAPAPARRASVAAARTDGGTWPHSPEFLPQCVVLRAETLSTNPDRRGRADDPPHHRRSRARQPAPRTGSIRSMRCPASHNDFLFDAIAHRPGGRMRALHPRHEQTSAYMALGAALATGRPQVCAVVPGPGVLNATAAAAHRLRDRRAGAGAGRPDPDRRHRQGLGPSARTAGPARPDAPLDQACRPDPGRCRMRPRWSPRRSASALSGGCRRVALECAIDAWGRPGGGARRRAAARSSRSAPSTAATHRGRGGRCSPRRERPIIIAGGGALDAGAGHRGRWPSGSRPRC